MIKIYLYIALTLTALFQALSSSAQQQKPQQQQQQTLVVKGKVLADDQKPQGNTAVYLMTAKTLAVIKTSVTNEQGEYIFTQVPTGDFIVQATAVGFETGRSVAFSVKAAAVQVEPILLKVQTQSIAAISVEARVPLIQQKDGKLVLNVENSTLAAGNTALDIIQRAPGVAVDKDDNLTLMGQQGVKITIDGRQTYMTGDQLASFLKTMDGNQIKSVEVSTSRSAKEDAEGAVGSINIVLKKNKLEGFTGSALASIAQGEKFRNNASVNFSYKKENTTVFGNYGYSSNPREIQLDIFRNVNSNTGVRNFDQESTIAQRGVGHSYKVGVEQKTSSRNTLLVQFTGDNNAERNHTYATTLIGKPGNMLDSILQSSSVSRSPFNRYSANLNNEFVINKASKLTFDFDWSAFRNRANTDYDYTTTFPDGSLVHAPEIEKSSMPSNIDIYAVKLDYEQTIGKSKLLFGGKYSRIKSDNDLQFDQFVNNQWQAYPGRSNHFAYTEQIAAGYADYSASFGKFSTKLGLRAEYTMSDGNSITLSNHVKRDYLDLFPSATVGYTANENNILSLSYARKVSRPNYRFLNPFEYFVDKFTSQRGNPYLNPQYTDGFALNYTLLKMFNFTLGTDITSDAIVESLGQNTETGQGWVTRDNLGKTVSSYLNINAPLRIGKIWSINNNLTSIHMNYKGPIAGSYLNVGSVFFQGRSAHNFRFSKAFSAEMSVNYNSPFMYNVYKMKSRWGADLGVNYNFKDERSSLKLAATDIFKTQKNKLSTNFDQYDMKVSQYNDNRAVRLTYSYKFGNLKQQVKRKNTDSDEKSRAL
ncbi:outer membrane beta-barrel family protein [Sphingobacterium sp. MYb382]|uniref:outer membrane beta-barrel family protein n=1 Tax=Sphingobacterium sp. MYb382 TaxID=2745278 RepID=UPI0030AA1A2E